MNYYKNNKNNISDSSTDVDNNANYLLPRYIVSKWRNNYLLDAIDYQTYVAFTNKKIDGYVIYSARTKSIFLCSENADNKKRYYHKFSTINLLYREVMKFLRKEYGIRL